MKEILKKLGEIGIIPVVKTEKASDAVNLGRALLAGELPVAQITFRTEAAEEAIRNLTRELPEMLAGAGTVLPRLQPSSRGGGHVDRQGGGDQCGEVR